MKAKTMQNLKGEGREGTSKNQDEIDTSNFASARTDKHLTELGSSVTRLGDLLDFGQVFKAFGNN